MTLLIAVSIYRIKHRLKQKHLLPFHDTNKLKEFDFKNYIFYYFDYLIKIEDFHFNNILIDEKSS